MSEKLLSNGTYFFKGEGGGTVTYTGGDYIEITDQNVINATGLQPAGDYATTAQLANKQDKLTNSQLSAISSVSGKADKSEIPSLDGYLKGSDLAKTTQGNISAISGSKLIATAAYNDSEGHNITATYPTKTSMSAYIGGTSATTGWADSALFDGTWNLKSLRGSGTTTPQYAAAPYFAGIGFGGSDTRGVITLTHQAANNIVTFAAGDRDKPNWYWKLRGTSGNTYNLDTFATKSEIPSLDGYLKGSDLELSQGGNLSSVSGHQIIATFDRNGNTITATYQPKSAMSGYSTTAHVHDSLSMWDLSTKELDLIDLSFSGYGSTATNYHTVFNIRSVAGGSAISGEPTDKTAKGDFTLEQIFTRKNSSTDYIAQQHLYWRDKEWTREVVKDNRGLSATDWAKVLNTSDMSGYATTAQLTGYYPITGGNVNGKVAASGTGSAASAQAAVIYAKVTNTSTNNQAGLGTNGSVWAGDYNNATSQTIGVRRKVGDKKLAGRFQLYADGNVSFQQIENTGADTITCQLQYGVTTAGNNWGTMTFGDTTKHIAYEEDLSGSYVKKTDYDNLYNMLTALSAKISASWTLEAGAGIAITNDETNKKTIISKV